MFVQNGTQYNNVNIYNYYTLVHISEEQLVIFNKTDFHDIVLNIKSPFFYDF